MNFNKRTGLGKVLKHNAQHSEISSNINYEFLYSCFWSKSDYVALSIWHNDLFKLAISIAPISYSKLTLVIKLIWDYLNVFDFFKTKIYCDN